MKTIQIAPITILAALFAALLSGCGKNGPAAPAAGASEVAALAVKAQAVTNRPFERRLTVQGTLEAKRFADVAARVEGNLDAVWVDEGDAVKTGETRLFQIDPVGLSNAVTIAEQALDVARAGLTVAQAGADKTKAEARKAALDFERYERLHKEGKVSNNEYETADTLHRQAQAGIAVAEAQIDLAGRQVRQAEAALAIARKHLDDSLTVSPIDGVVSLRSAEPGEQMSVGRTVLRLVDPRTLEAAAFIPAQYYASVQPGQTPFRLAVKGAEAAMHTVTYRSPTIDPTLRTFEIKGLVDNAAGLAVPGSMADITIVFETRPGKAVPTEAVLNRAGKQVVFVVRDGRAAQVEVATGLQNDGWTEILSGLAAGALVVTEGQTQLRDGAPVEVL
ncbi:MAG: efflux RND transporter periplasmic adaptor subunit [Kiritimatiellae bacterium]|nr:efflux RND transporter periplasmic adaptor subunit [Kiritimatiellia bacterium]